jgi:hypothetical protein
MPPRSPAFDVIIILARPIMILFDQDALETSLKEVADAPMPAADVQSVDLVAQSPPPRDWARSSQRSRSESCSKSSRSSANDSI